MKTPKTQKPLKISPSGKHNRTVNFLLDNGETLEIYINYTGPSSGYNGGNLDGEVIPFITTACNDLHKRNERKRKKELTQPVPA